jgi:hypothetical protein
MINYKKRERRRDDALRKGQHKVEILMKNKQIESYLWSNIPNGFYNSFSMKKKASKNVTHDRRNISTYISSFI